MAATDQAPQNDATNDAAALSLEDELLSAMAEIEAMKPGPEPAAPPPEPAPAEPKTEAPAEPASKGLKFKIGKKGDAKTGAATAKSAGSADGARARSTTPIDEITGALPRVPILKRGVRGVDALLEIASAPMTYVPQSVRKGLGLVSVVTIFVSVASATLLPMVLPYRDAITFLSQRRSALEAEQHAKAAGEEAGEESGGGHGAPAEGHGEKKDEKKAEKKPEKKADAHGKEAEGHGAKAEKKEEKKDGGHGGEAKKADKKPPKKDAKKKPDKKAGADAGGHGGH